MAAEKLNTAVRQEQIAEAAMRLVASHGMKGLSVAAVARRVGIVPSAIYRHFHGKDEVLDAVLELFQARVMGNVATVRSETADPFEQLRRLLVRHTGLIRENEALPRIIFSEDVHYRSAHRKARLLQIIRGFLEEVEKILREGQSAGCVRRDIDPGTASLMFIGLFQPAAVLWHLSDGDFDITRHTERAWKIFRRAIETP
jgi:AcrR family transcriptional regulator